jgi:hypothetical protein
VFKLCSFPVIICFAAAEEEREAARIAFEKNRKRHYEMGKVLGQPVVGDDDDDSEQSDETGSQAAKRTAASDS